MLCRDARGADCARSPRQPRFAAQLRRVIDGTSGKDTLRGNGDDNKIYGGRSADRLFGYGGNDLIRGGTGRDALAGGAGTTSLYGDEAADLMYGQDGDDQIWGATAPGQDVRRPRQRRQLAGESGDDEIAGGDGNDTLDGRLRPRQDVRATPATTRSTRQRGRHALRRRRQRPPRRRQRRGHLYGDDGDDYLIGGTARDQIYAGAGNDVDQRGRAGRARCRRA